MEKHTRHVIAVTGDGGIMMCLAELTTAVARGCQINVIVINDPALSLIDIKQQLQQFQSRGVLYPGRVSRRHKMGEIPAQYALKCCGRNHMQVLALRAIAADLGPLPEETEKGQWQEAN